MNIRSIALLTLLLGLALPLTIAGQETEYQEYTRRPSKILFLEIIYDKDHLEIVDPEGNAEIFMGSRRTNLKVQDRAVFFNDVKLCDKDGIYIDQEVYPWEEIYDIRVSEHDGQNVISFYRKADESDRIIRTRRGNLFKYSGQITVDEDEFIRGSILTAVGDIVVYGEVNRDIVALFGDIEVNDQAVARGDLVTISGDIDVEGDASVYGEIFGDKLRKKSRRRGRFYRPYDHHSIGVGLIYNRVDGAHPWLKYTYDDGGYSLPRVELGGGYAFNSERWRFHFGLEQTILHHPDLIIGGSFYRRLESEDMLLFNDGDHSCSENTAFALLATDDLMDYYESEGGSLYLKSEPMAHLKVKAGYHHEETDWLEGNRHLFSLFGGDKLFGLNFNTVDSGFREVGIQEIDTTENASLRFVVDYDSRSTREPFDHSAWAATAALEWSNPDMQSDFDYRRYTVSLRRYQEINRRTFLLLRFMYGGSDGYLPMHKRFFLGGLGTLRGYYHKEFMGTRFWMGNAEYRINFRRSALAMSVLYDVAQIANEQKIDDSIDYKQSLGLAVYLGNDTRVSIARRLDRADDKTAKFYVRLSHAF